jgi:hypothetical protein
MFRCHKIVVSKSIVFATAVKGVARQTFDLAANVFLSGTIGTLPRATRRLLFGASLSRWARRYFLRQYGEQ